MTKVTRENLGLAMFKSAEQYLVGDVYSIKIGIIKNSFDNYEVEQVLNPNDNNLIYVECFETQNNNDDKQIFEWDGFDVDEINERIDNAFEQYELLKMR